MEIREKYRIILIGPKYPVNVGTIASIMMNFLFRKLVLVYYALKVFKKKQRTSFRVSSRKGTFYLRLHGGRAPQWLVSRMIRLGGAIVEAIVTEFGTRALDSSDNFSVWYLQRKDKLNEKRRQFAS